MIDYSTQWLIQQIQQTQSNNCIWCIDENVLHQLPNIEHWPQKPLLITNRWDIAEQAKHLHFHCEFNDFDFSYINDASVDNIYYRISKEKAITHHIINEALRVLKKNGTLWLSGQKNEGIKTYIEKASVLFGCEKKINKDGANYYSCLTKYSSNNSLLADDHYTVLRECLYINEKPYLSKPGQFGWNKIDQGSELLIQALLMQEDIYTRQFAHMLDLGCGYGYLTLASQSLHIKLRTLTDNNAAALLSATANCTQAGLAATIKGSNAGEQLNNTFDLILCNPPFHQGFSVDGDLTDKFLRNAHRLLTNNGQAYFVVNEFIPLEKKAATLFHSTQLIAQDKRFKVFALVKQEL